METATPFPATKGLSASVNVAFVGVVLPVLLAIDPWEGSNVGLDIVESSNPLLLLNRDLLEYKDAGSADAVWKEARGAVSGLEDLDVEALAAEDEAEEELEGVNEEKTEPSTRFAVSREASFLNSNRNLDGVFGSGGDGRGSRSRGTMPAGNRVMCIECGRRCLGRQGGSGSRGGGLSATNLGGI